MGGLKKVNKDETLAAHYFLMQERMEVPEKAIILTIKNERQVAHNRQLMALQKAQEKQ